MSEDVNRDPLLSRLARFTPSTVNIDRDALLFAAGRASAPRASGWRLATAALALMQALTLSAWLAGPRSEPAAVTSREIVERPSEAEPLIPVEPLSPGSYGELVRQWENVGLPPPAPVADPVPARPPLTVAAGRRVDTFPY